VKVEWQDPDHKGIERLGEVISFRETWIEKGATDPRTDSEPHDF